MADAVRREIPVFEVASGFSRNLPEDVAEAILVVPVAVHCQPERIPSVVLLPRLPLLDPVLENQTRRTLLLVSTHWMVARLISMGRSPASKAV